MVVVMVLPCHYGVYVVRRRLGRSDGQTKSRHLRRGLWLPGRLARLTRASQKPEGEEQLPGQNSRYGGLEGQADLLGGESDEGADPDRG